MLLECSSTSIGRRFATSRGESGMASKGRMFAGCTVALVTPFRDGEVDYQALRDSVDWQIEQGTPVLSPVGTTGESPDALARRARAGDRHRRRAGRGPGQGDGRHRLERDLRGDPPDQVRRQGRGRRRPARLALLQPADPGRALRPLRQDRRGRATCRRSSTTSRRGPAGTSSRRRSSGWRSSARSSRSRRRAARSTRSATWSPGPT